MCHEEIPGKNSWPAILIKTALYSKRQTAFKQLEGARIIFSLASTLPVRFCILALNNAILIWKKCCIGLIRTEHHVLEFQVCAWPFSFIYDEQCKFYTIGAFANRRLHASLLRSTWGRGAVLISVLSNNGAYWMQMKGDEETARCVPSIRRCAQRGGNQ